MDSSKTSLSNTELQLLKAIAIADRPLAVFEIEPWLLAGLEKLLALGLVTNLRIPDLGAIIVPTDKAREIYLNMTIFDNSDQTSTGRTSEGSQLRRVLEYYKDYLSGLPDIKESWKLLQDKRQEKNELVLKSWTQRTQIEESRRQAVATDEAEAAWADLEAKRAELAENLQSVISDLQRMNAKLASLCPPPRVVRLTVLVDSQGPEEPAQSSASF